MKNIFSISEAKNKLPAIIHAVEIGSSVELTRHGKPVAVLLSVNDYNQMKKRGQSFWNALCDFRKTVASQGIAMDNPFSDGLRDRSDGREVIL